MKHGTIRVTREQVMELTAQNRGSSIGIDLSGCSLCGENLVDIDSLRGICFAGADLRGVLLIRANLKDSDFRDADLSCAPHNVVANLMWANLERAQLQRANLTGANLREAILREARLDHADLSQADLRGADLTKAMLEGAILKGAQLDEAVLTKAVLQGANLIDASLRLTEFSETSLDKDCIGDALLHERLRQYRDAEHIYFTLKRNFQEIGAYDSASWAYVKERTMERKTYFPLWAKQFYLSREVPATTNKLHVRLLRTCSFYLKYTWKWIGSFVLGAFWGYGEKPLNALYLSVVTIVVFTGLYWIFGGLATEPPRPLLLGDYFFYSLGAFTTNSFFQPVTPVAKFLTAFEAVFGITALAIFTAALGRRIGGH